MSWKDYEKWLLENILHKEENQDEYVFQPSVCEKYLLNSSVEEMETTLNNFLASVNRKWGDLTYHLLPEWEEGKYCESERCVASLVRVRREAGVHREADTSGQLRAWCALWAKPL